MTTTRVTGPSQNERVLAFIRANPGCTAMEISMRCSPWVSNPRARISDLRKTGVCIEPRKRPDGQTGFVVREAQIVTVGEQVGMRLA